VSRRDAIRAAVVAVAARGEGESERDLVGVLVERGAVADGPDVIGVPDAPDRGFPGGGYAFEPDPVGQGLCLGVDRDDDGNRRRFPA